VELDPVELRPRERARLVPDRVGDRGGTEVVHERCPAQRRDRLLGLPEDAGPGGRQLRAAATVPAHVRRFHVDEVGGEGQRPVERLLVEHPVGLGLEGQDGVPRLQPAEPVEPRAAVLDEQVRERRIVGPVAAIMSGLQGALGREEAADRLHVVAEMHDAHGKRDRLARCMGREARAVPALERAGQRVADP
jgi:hypothetical protein